MRSFIPSLLIGLLCLAGCAPRQEPVMTGAIENSQAGFDPAPEFSDAYTQVMQHTFSFVGEDMDGDLSPDGHNLTYASTANSRSSDIFVKPVNGKSYTQRTYDEGNDRFPVWSPDGRWILFASDRAGNWDLYLIPAEPDNKKPIRLTQRSGDELHPTWSPDGTRVAYNYFNVRKQAWEIWVLKMTDYSTYYICDGLMPAWNPDPQSNRIVFQRSRERNTPWFGIWTVNATPGKESEQTAVVAESKWAAINPSWSPDGKRIVFATVYKSTESREAASLFYADDIWVVDANGENQQQLTNDRWPDWNPQWAKNGRIFFNRGMNGQKNLWSLEPRLLPMETPSPDANETPAPETATDATLGTRRI